MRLFVSRIVLRTDRIEGGSSHLKWTAWIELARSGVFDSVLMCWLFQVESIAATWLRAQPDLIWPANLGESQRIFDCVSVRWDLASARERPRLDICSTWKVEEKEEEEEARWSCGTVVVDVTGIRATATVVVRFRPESMREVTLSNHRRCCHPWWMELETEIEYNPQNDQWKKEQLLLSAF